MVHKCITDVRYNAFIGMAKVCRDDEYMPQRTRKVIGKLWNQVIEDVCARNLYTKNIMWKSTDFLRRVVGGRRTRSHHFHIRS